MTDLHSKKCLSVKQIRAIANGPSDGPWRGALLDCADLLEQRSDETSGERTPKDYAIEHGEYMAQAALSFFNSLNDVAMTEQALETWDEADPEYKAAAERVDRAWEVRHDHWTALQNAVFEFRKRADRAKGAPETSAPPLCAKCGGHQTSTDAGNRPCKACGGTGRAAETSALYPNRGADHWLGELLAVIHADGGQYQAQHGTAQAVEDAVAKWYGRADETECFGEKKP